MKKIDTLLILASVIRFALILFGEWQDEKFLVKYTDIDYVVFTDAARFVYEGKSPYARSTYRYTPLLAMLLVPNISWFPQFGKVLFAFCDVLTGWLMFKLQPKTLKLISFVWLFNPFVITISTRGSSESILSSLVLLFLYLIMTDRMFLGAIAFGVSVHFKIYPVIYSIPLLVYISNKYGNGGLLNRFLCRRSVQFTVVSLLTFGLCVSSMYMIYGDEFLEETYLYHFTRKDHRHNYSAYFYHIYLTYSLQSSNLVKILAFVPQFLLVAIVGALLALDSLPLAVFAQTFCFVMLNKVCTSQYFIWYLNFLPLVLAIRVVHTSHYIRAVGLWVTAQMAWLYFAFQLEFKGRNTFRELWVASIIILLSNTWIITSIIKYRHSKAK